MPDSALPQRIRTARSPVLEKIGHPGKRAVLLAFRECGRINPACAHAGIAASMHYLWLSTDPKYRAAYEQAKLEFAQVLEDEAIRRAREGVKKPVTYQGKQIEINGQPVWEITYSDVLLIFMLKGLKPGTYRDNVPQDQRDTGDTNRPFTLADNDRLIQEAEKALAARAQQRMLNAPPKNKGGRSKRNRIQVVDVQPDGSTVPASDEPATPGTGSEPNH